MKAFFILAVLSCFAQLAQAKTVQVDSYASIQLKGAVLETGSKETCGQDACSVWIANASCIVAVIAASDVSCIAALENSSGEMIQTRLSNDQSVDLVNALRATHAGAPQCTPAGCLLTAKSVNCQYALDEKQAAHGGTNCTVEQ